MARFVHRKAIVHHNNNIIIIINFLINSYSSSIVFRVYRDGSMFYCNNNPDILYFLSMAIHCELFMRCVLIYEVVLISIRAQYNTLVAPSALLIM